MVPEACITVTIKAVFKFSLSYGGGRVFKPTKCISRLPFVNREEPKKFH